MMRVLWRHFTVKECGTLWQNSFFSGNQLSCATTVRQRNTNNSQSLSFGENCQRAIVQRKIQVTKIQEQLTPLLQPCMKSKKNPLTFKNNRLKKKHETSHMFGLVPDCTTCQIAKDKVEVSHRQVMAQLGSDYTHGNPTQPNQASLPRQALFRTKPKREQIRAPKKKKTNN